MSSSIEAYVTRVLCSECLRVMVTEIIEQKVLLYCGTIDCVHSGKMFKIPTVELERL